MKKLFCNLLAVLFLATPAFSQQTKVLTAEKHNEYGLVYSLPTTALQIKVKARRETKKAGPYNLYAKKFLGSSNAIAEDAVSTSILSVEVVPVGVKAESTQYLMQLKAGVLTYIGVDENGMLLSINAAPEAPAPIERTTQRMVSSTSTGNVDDYLQYVDMDFVAAQSSMKQAEMIANSLMDVRDAYLSLTRGTADNMPTDGRQLELMLNSLKEQEDALTRAFTGAVEVTEFEDEYLYIPEKDGEEVLCRISDFEGFVDKDDFTGFPLYIKTEITSEGSLPEDVNGEPKKMPKDAVIYAIPGAANITVYTDSNRFYNKELEFSQFGTVFGLAPSLFTDKKAPSYARFSPVTGALLEIGKASESIQ